MSVQDLANNIGVNIGSDNFCKENFEKAARGINDFYMNNH